MAARSSRSCKNSAFPTSFRPPATSFWCRHPQLAQARLQLGAAQVPGSDVATAWDRLEDAPMTASDLAQSTMAVQALELSLQQSIENMSGIHTAQVFLALPPDTPFLADQPKPTASVVIAGG